MIDPLRLLGATALLVAVSLAHGQAIDDSTASSLSPGASSLDQIVIAPLDVETLLREDSARSADGQPPRFAVPHPVNLTLDNAGTWSMAGPDTLRWRLRITSPGALSINLGFTGFEVPEGAELLIATFDGSSALRPFTVDDNEEHGQLWTPVLPSDDIVIDLTVTQNELPFVLLELGSINIGYRGFFATVDGHGSLDRSGSCNLDVACGAADGWPDVDDWRDEIPGVAVISTGGAAFCTGFVVNNTAQDLTPYFMTANHCGIDSSNTASLVCYWNYENSYCRQPNSGASGEAGNGSLSQFNTGSIFRASYPRSDFTLVELDDPIDPAFLVSYLGWDRSGADATMAVGIHHPSADEKRISFEFQATTTTSHQDTSVPGDETHIRVIDWDIGTTESGSSGSPLFNEDHQVIGQLHGGYAACGNSDSDWYGKFSRSWTGGGSSSNRLSDWLDPTGSGALAIGTLVPRVTAIVGLDSVIWDDSLGDGDYIPEVDEPLQAVVCLSTTQPIENVNVDLVLITGCADITDYQVDYGSMSPTMLDCGDDDFDLTPLCKTNVFEFRVTFEQNGQPGSAVLPYLKYFPSACETDPIFDICQIDINDSQGCGNGNGVLESGEHAEIRVRLRNDGDRQATGVHVALTPGTCEAFFTLFETHSTNYPNMPNDGSCTWATNPDNHWDVIVPRDWSGVCNSSIVVYFDDSPCSPQVFTNALHFDVQPAAWVDVSPKQYDFGVASTSELIDVPVMIRNDGNAPMTVSGLVPSSPTDTSWSGATLPLQIPAGGMQPITITVDTSQLTVTGQITRSVDVLSDAHICEPGGDNRITIEGFVSDGPPIIPLGSGIDRADVSGNRVVYASNRSGNYDIYMYDLDLDQEFQLTDDPASQFWPMISGSLVVWEDNRNWNGSGQSTNDIYAFDLTTGCEFAVSTDPADEGLRGVDGDWVAFVRQYYADPCSTGVRPENLYAYHRDGQNCPPSGSTYQLTTYTHNGTNPMQSAADHIFDADFGRGTLAWSETTYTWNGACWGKGSSGPTVKAIEIGSNTPGPADVFSIPCIGNPIALSADNGRIAYDDRPDPLEYQVFLWKSGACSRVSLDDDIEHEYPVLWGDLVVYHKRTSPTILVCLDLSTSEESLVTAEYVPEPWRMDGHLVAWTRSNQVYCAYVKQADPSIGASSIEVSAASVVEGVPFDVDVVVTNVAPTATTEDITVELYDGDPSARAQMLCQTTMAGGLPALGQGVASCEGVSLAAEGTHELCVVIGIPSGDNPTNNRACVSVGVQDSDTLGPSIADVLVQEEGGDGDGIIERGEQARISWTLSDPSGIASAELLVDGNPVAVTGTYFGITDPLCAGDHGYLIRATDADNTASMSLFPASVQVPPPACVGDIDNDGDTDVFDFGVLAGHFTMAVEPCTNGDLDRDGDVDIFDFAILAPDFQCVP